MGNFRRNQKVKRKEAKMRSAILLRCLICLPLTVLSIFSAGQLGAQTEEKLLEDINRLPEAER
jgi:hypothetical protein